jgi:hypothetical protein
MQGGPTNGVELTVDGVVANSELAGIEALEWRVGAAPLAPLVIHTNYWPGDDPASPLMNWLKVALDAGNGSAPTKTLELTVIESGKVVEAWQLRSARIVKVEFDDFVAGSAAPWNYTLTIEAGAAVAVPLQNQTTRVSNGSVSKLFRKNDFSASFGSFPTDKIRGVSGLTVALDGSSKRVNAVLTIGMSEYSDYAKGRTAAGTQDLVISILGKDARDVYGYLTLTNAAFQRMTLPLREAPALTKFEVGLTASSIVLDFRFTRLAPRAVAAPTPLGVTPLPNGTLRATVATGQVNRYSATVSAGTQVVSLTGIVGAAKLDVYSDAGFTQPVTCLAPGNLANSTYSQPADCSFTVAGGMVYVSVTGTTSSVTTGNRFNLRVSPRNEAAAAIQGTTQNPVVIQPDKPFAGTGGSDNSYYKVTTQGTGDVVISMTGLIGTEDLGLHIYDNDKFVGPELDNVNCHTGAYYTFAESCNVPAGQTYYLEIRSASPGGPFTLMVDSPAGAAATAAPALSPGALQQAVPASSTAP